MIGEVYLYNVAVTMLVYLLPIKPAHTLVMYNSNQVTFQLAYLQVNIMMMLCSSSIKSIFHTTSAAFENCINPALISFVAFLTD